MDLTVAIPAFRDDPVLLARVVEAAAEQVDDVVLVDMSPSPGLAAVASGHPGVRYHHLPDSTGVSRSRNECIRLASTRFVLFLDSDAIPAAGWAQAMFEALAEPEVAVVGARVVASRQLPALFRTATASDWLSLFDLGDEAREVPRVMGTSYAIDRERIGETPFDERLGRQPGVALGHEEVQLALDAVLGDYADIHPGFRAGG